MKILRLLVLMLLLGGLVSALCVISPDMGPIGKCAVGGLASRLVPPSPTTTAAPDASP